MDFMVIYFVQIILKSQKSSKCRWYIDSSLEIGKFSKNINYGLWSFEPEVFLFYKSLFLILILESYRCL